MIVFTTELSDDRFDYVIDKVEKLEKLIPHMYRKISGDWKIELVDPDISYIRQLLDFNIVPEYVELLLVVKKECINTLSTERPQLNLQEKSIKVYYEEMLASLPVLIESSAVRMIWKYTSHTRKDLQAVLEKLTEQNLEKGKITYKDVKSVVAVHRTYYASQVLNSFVKLEPKRWYKLHTFILELGEEKAFYTMRKYVRKLVTEKVQYLGNKEYTDRNVTVVDGYTLAFINAEFYVATAYTQLCPIMMKFERRLQNNVSM